MNIIDLYTLKLIPGIGDTTLRKIIDSRKSIRELVDADEEELKTLIARNRASVAIHALKEELDHFQEKAVSDIDAMHECGIEMLTSESEQYPQYFHLIKDKPLFLYCRGNLDLLNNTPSVAIIGTRECTQSGFLTAQQMARAFVKKGYCIVSGLAEGIDTAAHKGALMESGNTISVLVDVKNIYPKANSQLSEDIINNGGLLIAENPPGCKAVGGLFVKRDRLQSALSLAVVPIETAVKGGTMHTVRYAGEQKMLLLGPDFSTSPSYNYNTKQFSGISKLMSEDKLIQMDKDNISLILSKLLPKKELELQHLLEDRKIQSDLFGSS